MPNDCLPVIRRDGVRADLDRHARDRLRLRARSAGPAAKRVDRSRRSIEPFGAPGQRAELDADRANGVLSPDQFEVARSELERRVVDETCRAAESAAPARASAWAVAIVGAGLPIAALVLYLTLGTPAALLPEFSASQAPGQRVAPQEIDTLIERVKERLASRPDDVEGWRVLARTYLALGRVAEALSAYERATALAPNDADVLAEHAEATSAIRAR